MWGAFPAARLKPHLPALTTGLIAVALMLVWAIHDGGYDADTWYWGALLLLAALATTFINGGNRAMAASRASRIALSSLVLYVAWSYVSISWARSPGDALEGSNRALLYLLVFALMFSLPWTAEGALTALVAFALGVGLIAVVILIRLASQDHVSALVIEGRLAAPTGYFNSTAALFTIGSLTAILIAVRRELPALLRGGLLACAYASLQLALIVQSRGWLFTLPLVALAVITVSADRLRVIAASGVVVAASLASISRLLNVYDSSASTAALNHAAGNAGKSALLAGFAVLVAGSLIARGEKLMDPKPLGPIRRRQLGAAVALVVVLCAGAGGVIATHGHPVRFIVRQWRGFSHVQTSSSGSHFADVGSGRYDFWRVSLDAFVSHPIGGLGQDNFADYYVLHRRTGDEPKWTHSLEMRLLAHTGIVGVALFAVFIAAALTAAVGARRRGEGFVKAATAAALVPLLVWLIHGSVDWFWEVPALTAPALGFLAVAAALGEPYAASAPGRFRWPQLPRAIPIVASTAAFIGAAFVLALPYLAIREVSTANNIGTRNPIVALSDLSTAADLNPLSPDPSRLAGSIALQAGLFNIAEQRFRQTISREPGGWFAWLGDGLAASALGDPVRAYHDFKVASSINSRQQAIQTALARVYTTHPLTPIAAFQLLTLAG